MATTTRVVMPQLGESVHEGTISRWFVKPGDRVTEFEPLLEVDTDKVSGEVPSPVSGVLKEILAKEGQTVQAGAEIAVVEVGANGAAAVPVPSPPRGEGQGEGRQPAAPPVPSPPRGERPGAGWQSPQPAPLLTGAAHPSSPPAHQPPHYVRCRLSA